MPGDDEGRPPQGAPAHIEEALRPTEPPTSRDSTPEHRQNITYDWLDRANSGEPEPDPFCGRCGGPSGPAGAWCDQCIHECREYTRQLDQRDKRVAA